MHWKANEALLLGLLHWRNYDINQSVI